MNKRSGLFHAKICLSVFKTVVCERLPWVSEWCCKNEIFFRSGKGFDTTETTPYLFLLTLLGENTTRNLSEIWYNCREKAIFKSKYSPSKLTLTSPAHLFALVVFNSFPALRGEGGGLVNSTSQFVTQHAVLSFGWGILEGVLSGRMEFFRGCC